MKNNSLIILFVTLVPSFCIIVSCSNVKKAMVDKNAIESFSAEQLYNSIIKNELFCENMKCKAEASVVFNNNIYNLKGIIYYKSPNEIFINATLLNVNIFSAYIHNDSILIINKIQKVFLDEPLEFTSTKFGWYVNNRTFEDILFGRIINEYFDRIISYELKDNMYSVCLNNSSVHYFITVPATEKHIVSSVISSNDKTQKFNIQYPNYYSEGKQQIPSEINLSSIYPEFNIDIKLSNFEFDNGANFKVNIPPNFERVKW